MTLFILFMASGFTRTVHKNHKVPQNTTCGLTWQQMRIEEFRSHLLDYVGL